MFEIYTEAQYRGLDLDALNMRGEEIAKEFENAESAHGYDELMEQLRLAEREIEVRKAQAKARSLKMQQVASGAGAVIERSDGAIVEHDATGSMEYRKAFMDYMQRGIRSDVLQFRTPATSVTGQNGAVIPSTIVAEIIKKIEVYGELFSRCRKLNIKGGVSFPVIDTIPTASWVTEAAPSEDKALQSGSITFTYHMVEVKLAQSQLLSIVSIDAFEAQFATIAVEAIVKAVDIAIVNGTGSGQPLGIINDTRIPSANKRELSSCSYETWTSVLSTPKGYRRNQLIVNQNTWDEQIKGLVDDNGQPIARVDHGINGEEIYRFLGKEVITVEDDVLPAWASADDEDVVAILIDLPNYAINSNMELTLTQWVDNDNNKVKNKAQMVIDGRILDANGVFLISKESL